MAFLRTLRQINGEQYINIETYIKKYVHRNTFFDRLIFQILRMKNDMFDATFVKD